MLFSYSKDKPVNSDNPYITLIISYIIHAINAIGEPFKFISSLLFGNGSIFLSSACCHNHSAVVVKQFGEFIKGKCITDKISLQIRNKLLFGAGGEIKRTEK